MPHVYLAGPEVFLPDRDDIGARKKARCAERGLVGLWPGDATAGLDDPTRVFDALVAMLDDADAVIANLTPWRGIGADPGTAFEVGYAYARGGAVFAYTHDARDHAHRVEPDGNDVEPWNLAENLMLEGPRLVVGERIVRVDVPAERRWVALDGFDACLDLAVAHCEEHR